MRNPLKERGAVVRTAVLLAAVGIGLGAVAAQTKAPARPATNAAGEADAEQLASTRSQLIELLRMSPKMASFVKRDPLLLSDQEYVNRTNPKLAEFLKDHPEIGRNPEFYLFADIGNQGGSMRDVYIDESPWIVKQDGHREDILAGAVAFTVFVIILSVLIWLLRVMLENRRWNRVFKVQTEIYNKLLDKFSSNEEMLAYIRSESGKRVLDTATLPVAGMQQQIPNPVARVLTPLQLGIVGALVGAGLIYVRSSVPDVSAPLSVFGTLALMGGIGFIISAGLAFGLARHLGMLPQREPAADDPLNQHPEAP